MSLGPLMCDVAGLALNDEDRELLGHPAIGGVILFGRNFADTDQLKSLVTAIHEVRNPPLLVAVDQEGGRIQRFRDGFSTLPTAQQIGRQYDADPEAAKRLARYTGWLMAAELRAVGVDFSFAPVVDLDRGLSEVIGDRALHGKADVVGELAVSVMLGMRDSGMAATAKHFPGHGGVVADSHQSLPVDRRVYGDLLEDMGPYERLIRNSLPGVMTAHVQYPELDAAPCSFSRYWLQAELRERLGFDGAIFSDDLTMKGAEGAGDLPTRARMALEAGCDMLLICNDRAGVNQLLDALGDYSNPPGQVRLVRMRGRPAPGFDELLASVSWAEAAQNVAAVLARPGLTLDS